MFSKTTTYSCRFCMGATLRVPSRKIWSNCSFHSSIHNDKRDLSNASKAFVDGHLLDVWEVWFDGVAPDSLIGR